MKKIIKLFLLISLGSFIFSGCSNKNQEKIDLIDKFYNPSNMTINDSSSIKENITEIEIPINNDIYIIDESLISMEYIYLISHNVEYKEVKDKINVDDFNKKYNNEENIKIYRKKTIKVNDVDINNSNGVFHEFYTYCYIEPSGMIYVMFVTEGIDEEIYYESISKTDIYSRFTLTNTASEIIEDGYFDKQVRFTFHFGNMQHFSSYYKKENLNLFNQIMDFVKTNVFQDDKTFLKLHCLSENAEFLAQNRQSSDFNMLSFCNPEEESGSYVPAGFPYYFFVTSNGRLVIQNIFTRNIFISKLEYFDIEGLENILNQNGQ